MTAVCAQYKDTRVGKRLICRLMIAVNSTQDAVKAQEAARAKEAEAQKQTPESAPRTL